MEKARYMISDAARMVALEQHVLRYWEDELELPIARNEMGHRYYTEDNIRMFHRIKELKEQGYQLKAIKTLLPEMEQGKIPPAIVKPPEPPMNARIEQFQYILGKVVSQALRETQQEMGKELSHTGCQRNGLPLPHSGRKGRNPLQKTGRADPCLPEEQQSIFSWTPERKKSQRAKDKRSQSERAAQKMVF